MSESGTACSPGCGYVSSGLDLWLHSAHEHKPCAECGRKPNGGDSVTHKPDCPRLQPGYIYPGPIPAGFEESEELDQE